MWFNVWCFLFILFCLLSTQNTNPIPARRHKMMCEREKYVIPNKCTIIGLPSCVARPTAIGALKERPSLQLMGE